MVPCDSPLYEAKPVLCCLLNLLDFGVKIATVLYTGQKTRGKNMGLGCKTMRLRQSTYHEATRSRIIVCDMCYSPLHEAKLEITVVTI